MQPQKTLLSAFLSWGFVCTAVANPSSTLELNRFTFKQNVLTVGNNHVEHWIVRFCHDWYSPCERIAQPFKELADQFTDDLNFGSTVVRFANVDCSVDKPLCNEQAIDTFPKIIHYSRQQKVAQWDGRGEQDAQRLRNWLGNQFANHRHAKIEEVDNGNQQPNVGMSIAIPDWVPSVPDLHLQETKDMITRHTGALAKASITIGLAASIVSISCAIQKEFASVLRVS